MWWFHSEFCIQCQQGLTLNNWELLHLLVPDTLYEEEIIWLIGNYISYAWSTSYVRNKVLKVEKFFGFLAYKYENSFLNFGHNLGLC